MGRRSRDGAPWLGGAAGHDGRDREVRRPGLALLRHHPVARPALRAHIHQTLSAAVRPSVLPFHRQRPTHRCLTIFVTVSKHTDTICDYYLRVP